VALEFDLHVLFKTFNVDMAVIRIFHFWGHLHFSNTSCLFLDYGEGYVFKKYFLFVYACTGTFVMAGDLHDLDVKSKVSHLQLCLVL
jgi:hypothetical protein